ncbi:MAG: ribonuclease HII [Bacilli bacterium]|nr:ribonuclease HII [Bacilli bacterium]
MALDYEQQYYNNDIKYIVGLDEAGRGCLLGDVFAGAVILPKDFKCDLINDSKKLSEKQREEAYQIIVKNAIAFGVGRVSAEEIDQINILNASRLAMERAIENMNHDFDMIISDAVKMINFDCPKEALIHGDALAECVAAASIIAKVSRDHYCYELDKQYPLYQIGKHKGYGTKLHMDILKQYGPIPHLYRFSYAPIKNLKIEKITLF